MDVTDYILTKTNRIKVEPEVTPGKQAWSMFTDAGTEIEVSEFLHSLVRMIKPSLILETGTHVGISSTYMGLALERNNKGALVTFEIIASLQEEAKKLWKEVGVDGRIEPMLLSATAFDPQDLVFDMLFLDSEPQYRFDEFIKFWPSLVPGGLIVVHDLHPSLGHHGQTHHNVYDWPYGDFREKLGPYLKNHMVQTISFPTPRGFTIFQKEAPGFEAVEYIKEQS